MPTAQSLFAHALRMLAHDPATTLRVLMPGLLLIIASTIGMTQFLPEEIWSPTVTPDQLQNIQISNVSGVLLAGLAGIAGYVVTAVLWHRYVLLMGSDRAEPLFPGLMVVAGYLWRVIIVGALQVLAGLPIIAVSGAIAAGISIYLGGLVAGILFFWIALRISLILPAAAMGQRLTIAQSWGATAPVSMQLWGVAVMLALLSTVIGTVISLFAAPASDTMIWLQTGAAVIEGLISLSILTTLYGHLIEGRPLT